MTFNHYSALAAEWFEPRSGSRKKKPSKKLDGFFVFMEEIVFGLDKESETHISILFDMYSVYILHSEKLSKYYIGSTKDTEIRILEHNSIENSNWTKTGSPWVLMAEIKFKTLNQARKIEYFIKSKKKKSFVELVISKQKELEFINWMISKTSE